MPLFDQDLEAHTLPGNYGYSATRIDKLGAAEYTLVSVEADNSGSIYNFAAEVNRCIRDTVESCRRSPRADNLLIRVGRFDHRVEEHHGFKPLADCHAADYDTVVHGGGSTALYDGAHTGIAAITSYGKQLADADFSVNGILVVITDGDDNASVNTPTSVGKALKEVVTGEKIESIVSILVGINMADAGMTQRLETFAKDAGFTQFIDAGKADAKSLAKLAAFISKSISSQSTALGSGGASKALVF